MRRSLPTSVAVVAIAWLATCLAPRGAEAQLSGVLGAHDPSTVLTENGRFTYFATGDLLATRTSTNLSTWSAGPAALASLPSWIPAAVPGYAGQSLWAPDVIKLGDTYHLYYSASIWGTKLSAIGHATSPTLDPSAANYGWTDRGMVIGSNHGSPYNAIDPALLRDQTTGRLWMSWGSFNSGIYVKELDPVTGTPLSASPGVNVAAPGPTPEIEGSSLVQHDGMYYLFVNWGGCCAGVNSTYNIRVGRSASPTGPFLDRDGTNLLAGGGTLFLDDDGPQIGPGHFSLTTAGGRDQFSYHYYNGDANGAPTFALRDLSWSADGWPLAGPVASQWKGGGSGTWSAAGNWSSAAIPDGIGQLATIEVGSGLTTVTLPAAGVTVGTINFRGAGLGRIATAGGRLALDAATGQIATLNVADGSHLVQAAVVAADPLGVNVTPIASTLTISGSLTAPRLSKYGQGTLTVGGSAAIAGSVFVKRGTLDLTGTIATASFSSVGQILGDTAAMTVRGTGRFASVGDLNIGDTGDASTAASGTLAIQDQATVTVTGGGLFVGSGFSANTRADGHVIQTGGTLTVTNAADGSFVVGGRGSSLATGRYDLDGGAVIAATNVFVGGRGQGTVEQAGGSFTANSYLSIGRFAGSVGQWTIVGGTLAQTGSTLRLIVGEEGQGLLSVRDTASVLLSGTLRLGHQATGAGTLRLDGGLMRTPAVTRGAGSAAIVFNGGTLQATRSTTGFLGGLTSATVEAGGAVIDSSGFTVTISQPLLHDATLGATVDGGLVKRGFGTLALAAANTFAGPTRVEAGTLRIGHDLALAKSPVSVAAGATLAINAGVSASIPSLSIAGGRLDIGSGRVTLPAGGISASDLVGLLRVGRAGGGWNSSTGIVSTAASAAIAAGMPRAVGWIEKADVVTIAFAAPGDVTLDGVVDVLDVATLLTSGRFDTTMPAVWATGDFTYDGVFDILDVSEVLAAGVFHGGPYLPAAVAAVPEPNALPLLAVIAAGSVAICRGRRRR
ncbi:MAG: family 43 glycosylhydrolase [Pirellulales bacterium]